MILDLLLRSHIFRGSCFCLLR